MGFVDPHRQIQTRGGFGNVDGNHDPRLSDIDVSPKDVEIPIFLSDIPEVRQEMAEYYKAIHRMDQGVGRTLDALERTGAADATLVLFLSDNGPPLKNSKTALFEAGVRLPFLIRAPGRSAGGIVNSNLVSFIDVLPTFLDWAGHEGFPSQEGNVQRRGRLMLPIAHCKELEPSWDRVFRSHTFHEITNYRRNRYMRDSRYKYHRNVCWKLDFPFSMDLYASLSWEGIRNSRGKDGSQPMIGPRRFKDYICRPPEEL